MMDIELVVPSKELASEALAYRQEHFDHNEPDLHGGALLDQTASYNDWLEQVINNSNEETVNPDWVVSSTFFVVRKIDRRIIGMIDIRHSLNQLLRDYGGHIGYGVRPSERNKGYAKEILRLGLEYCEKIGLEKVMLACYKENEASRRTIIKCGGTLEKEFLHTDGRIVQLFWIILCHRSFVFR